MPDAIRRKLHGRSVYSISVVDDPGSESKLGAIVRALTRLMVILGAKLGANSARRQATLGHNKPVPSQVNDMSGYAQRHLATAKV